MEIFDISKKGTAQKIYSFEEAPKCNNKLVLLFNHLTLKTNAYYSLAMGWGDITYNSRRNIIDALSIRGKTDYHLLRIDYDKFSSVENQKCSYGVIIQNMETI